MKAGCLDVGRKESQVPPASSNWMLPGVVPAVGVPLQCQGLCACGWRHGCEILPAMQMGAMTILWYCITDPASSLLRNPITRLLPLISNLITHLEPSALYPVPNSPLLSRRWIFKITALLRYNSYTIKFTPWEYTIKWLFKNMYLFFYFTALDLSCGLWDLVPWPGVEPWPPALGVCSLSHWTIREVPNDFLCIHKVA